MDPDTQYYAYYRPYKVEILSEPVLPDTITLGANSQEKDDDPFEPFAENEADFQPSRFPLLYTDSRHTATITGSPDSWSGSPGTTSSWNKHPVTWKGGPRTSARWNIATPDGKLLIEPEHQYKTGGAFDVALTFTTPNLANSTDEVTGCIPLGF